MQEEGKKHKRREGLALSSRSGKKKNIAKTGFTRYMRGEVSHRFNMLDSHPEENKTATSE